MNRHSPTSSRSIGVYIIWVCISSSSSSSTRIGQALVSRSTSTWPEHALGQVSHAPLHCLSQAFPQCSVYPGSLWSPRARENTRRDKLRASQAQAPAGPEHSHWAIKPMPISARCCLTQVAITRKGQSHARGRNSQFATKAVGQYPHCTSSRIAKRWLGEYRKAPSPRAPSLTSNKGGGSELRLERLSRVCCLNARLESASKNRLD